MASNSPVVISSSPSLRLPSLTPQSNRNAPTAVAADSSSPGLLPLSEILKQQGLRSGSRAQQVPQGAASGFASAASLLKSHHFEPEQPNGDDIETAKPAKKSTGKLAKPKKAQTTIESKEKGIEAQSPLSEFAYPALPARRASASASPAPRRDPATNSRNPEATRSRRPSISLSEFDFRPEEHRTHNSPQRAPEKPAKKARKRTTKDDGTAAENAIKKPRKRAPNPTEAPGDVPTKKPKKKFAKSESIILNSDEPDPVPAVSIDANTKFAAPTSVRSPFPIERPEAIVSKAQDKETSGVVKDSTKSAQDVDHSNLSGDECEQSTYFAKQPDAGEATDTPSDLTAGPPSEARPLTDVIAPAAFPTALPALRRRLSWTPVKNSKAAPADLGQRRPSIASSTGSETPNVSLKALVSNFGYSDQKAGTPPVQRTTTGEALTKRRRIELPDVSTVAPAVRKAPESAPPEPIKKPKAKKRPKTITELATKAYQDDDDPQPAQATVSEFFSAQQQAEAGPSEAKPGQETAKPKKPRKPRAKKTDAETSAQASSKAAKSRKTKVKFKETDFLAKLYSPEKARAQEHSQDFVFGTSSQLAVEESPTFIREMQVAVRESEALSTSQVVMSPQKRSRIRVSSAPHGTNLSIGQAQRDLWCTAARDEHGDFLEVERARPSHDVHDESCRPKDDMTVRAGPAITGTASPQQSDAQESKPMAAEQAHHSRSLSPTNDIVTHDDDEVIDLCHTSPAAAHDSMLPSRDDTRPTPPLPKPDEPSAEANAPPSPAHQASDGDWMLLNSEDSVITDTIGTNAVPSMAPQPPAPAHSVTVPTLKRSATSPMPLRSALQTLDANITLPAQTSPIKNVDFAHQRALTTSATSNQPPKRPRGRPRKEPAAAAAPIASPKRRGRSPKSAANPAESTTVSPRRKKSKPATNAISASQPAASSGWLNIDEISDSDSPMTSSPPRRRATSSPPEVRPLDLAVTASPSVKAKGKAPAAATSTLKPTDPSVATIMEQLFPQITTTVRSTPPSTDMSNPTWHEKILLYDPIVLEDLTAWLNEQGLGIETQRLKPKPKTKGRKKKDAPPDEPEYEKVKEELRPWMVQKWCEEKSICCLWKEGLRGGVRTRY